MENTETADAPVEEVVTDVATEVIEQPTTEFNIPDAYKDKPWVQKIKGQDDLWKQLDHTQSLIGKKHVVPDFDKATPEELEAFFSNVRPSDKDKYAETLDFGEIDDDSKGFFTDLLHKSAVPPKLANEMIKAYHERIEAQKAGLYDTDNFMGVLERSFGQGYKEKAGHLAKSIKGTLSADDQALLEQMPNEFVGLVYRLTNSYVQQYGAKEGESAAGKASTVNTDYDAQWKAKFQEIQDIDKRPHTAEQKSKLVNELAEINMKRGTK